MAIVAIHPEIITGPWLEGCVLDRHVVSSVFLGEDEGGHPRFDNTRSTLGELLYQLKNQNGPADDIIETAVDFVLRNWPSRVDCVISPPPSIARTRQPAAILASGIARGDSH